MEACKAIQVRDMKPISETCNYKELVLTSFQLAVPFE
jgi:hypothetical protein